MPDGETSYKTEVQKYTDEELLTKERSKRRRKTSDVVGTGLSAAAAMATPAMWAAAGASAKNYLDNSTKHKIILKEMSRRGLQPMKEDMSDTVLPILASAGSMFVGRAFGGAAGQGMASQAGNLLQTVGSRAFNSGVSRSASKSSKKDKKDKKVLPLTNYRKLTFQNKTSPAMIPYTPQQGQVALTTPSAYQVPPNQPPPATIVYNYIPPSAQYPQGYYAPAPVTLPAATQYQPQPPVFQQPPPQQQQAAPMYQPIPPALQYLQTPPQPQYYGNQGLQRAQTIYGNPPAYQAAPTRAQTFPYM